jgi:hypothetical protein
MPEIYVLVSEKREMEQKRELHHQGRDPQECVFSAKE